MVYVDEERSELFTCRQIEGRDVREERVGEGITDETVEYIYLYIYIMMSFHRSHILVGFLKNNSFRVICLVVVVGGFSSFKWTPLLFSIQC